MYWSTVAPTSTNPATTNGIIILEKIAPREVQIPHHEFDDLKQTTKDQIIFVYDRTTGPNTSLDGGAFSSHSRICQTLRFLGVEIFEYNKNSLTTPEDLLANSVYEWNKLLLDRYEADPDTKSLKEQAARLLGSWWAEGHYGEVYSGEGRGQGAGTKE
jgi:hypothetical protein